LAHSALDSVGAKSTHPFSFSRPSAMFAQFGVAANLPQKDLKA